MQLVESLPRIQHRYRNLWPAAYWLITAIGVFWVIGIVSGLIPYGTCGNTGTVPCDAYSYWAVDATPYTWETNLEYRYSPAFLWLIYPFQALPFEVFVAVWTAAHIGALIWLRAGWFLIVPLLNDDVLRGNTSTFMALFAVLAIERSATWWAPALLTKITPAIGIVWHAVRGEWRSLLRLVLITAAIVAVGWVIAPDLWIAWVRSLLGGDSTYEVGHPLGPLPLRLATAAILVAFGARTSRAWLVPIAMFLAIPGLWAFSWALLAGIPRLLTWRPKAEPAAP
jgi:hypothetical protein